MKSHSVRVDLASSIEQVVVGFARSLSAATNNKQWPVCVKRLISFDTRSLALSYDKLGHGSVVDAVEGAIPSYKGGSGVCLHVLLVVFHDFQFGFLRLDWKQPRLTQVHAVLILGSEVAKLG